MKISVIICTYNRWESLSTVLDSLCKQEIDGSFDHEIVVVDNNSNDRTRDTVASFIKSNPHIHYVFEPRKGLSQARNTGIESSTGEILAFTDDDVVITRDYIQNIANFTRTHDYDAMGGRVLPIYPKNTPQWIKDNKLVLAGPIVCHDYGDKTRLYDQGMLPFIGANMVFKRAIFDKIGKFNVEIGAGKGTMGEDTEIFNRIKKGNARIFHNPNVLVHHPVEKSRMTLSYIAKWNVLFGKYIVLRDNSPEKISHLICYFGVPRYLFPEIAKHLMSIVFSFGVKKKFIEAWALLFWKIGMVQAYRAEAKKYA